MDAIDSFSGQYRFLSNFFPARVFLDGVSYQSVEHAYQAAKTISPHVRELFLSGTAGQAKRKGRAVPLRDDWESIKFDVMLKLLLQKFGLDEHPELAELLAATWPRQLIEGNDWDDRVWGVCNGIGENHLGKLLMEVRDHVVEAMDAIPR